MKTTRTIVTCAHTGSPGPAFTKLQLPKSMPVVDFRKLSWGNGEGHKAIYRLGIYQKHRLGYRMLKRGPRGPNAYPVTGWAHHTQRKAGWHGPTRDWGRLLQVAPSPALSLHLLIGHFPSASLLSHFFPEHCTPTAIICKYSIASNPGQASSYFLSLKLRVVCFHAAFGAEPCLGDSIFGFKQVISFPLKPAGRELTGVKSCERLHHTVCLL